jgi:glycosyltransferase involved in cell wall biosynthesis
MRSRRQNSGRPLKILFIGADLSTGGGVNKVVRDLAVLFTNEMRAKVTVVAARGAAAPTYDFPPDIVVERHQRRSLSAYFALLVRLRRRQFDVVISSWAQENILTALAFAGSGAKVVLVEHAPWHFHGRVIRAVRRLAYPLATSVVALNRRDYDYHRRLVRDVRLIPNPVLVPAAVPASARQKLVLAIGHLEPLKQFDHALSAMKGSGLEEDGWSLALIGSGNCETELRALIDLLGLKNATIHCGRQNLEPWYAKASILLVTSRLESFSLVLAEAMGHGVVPIAYASDGPSMILEDFPEQLVPMGDVDELAQRLRRYAVDDELDGLRAELVSSVRRRFSADIVMRSWKKLLGAGREE